MATEEHNRMHTRKADLPKPPSLAKASRCRPFWLWMPVKTIRNQKFRLQWLEKALMQQMQSDILMKKQNGSKKLEKGIKTHCFKMCPRIKTAVKHNTKSKCSSSGIRKSTHQQLQTTCFLTLRAWGLLSCRMVLTAAESAEACRATCYSTSFHLNLWRDK